MVLYRAVRVIEVQKELLVEELQVSSEELGVVFFGQTGQPQADGLKRRAAHLLAAVVQPFEQL